MIYTRPGRAARGAFTLVEILVVILIIALLVSITAAGVLKIMYKGPEIRTASDIRQFEVAIQQFQQEFGVNYIPSYLVLWEDNTKWNLAIPAQKNSYTYLTRVFGKYWQSTPFIDWNGNGQNDTTAQPLVLEGEHCLTFFLGGIPSPPSPPAPPNSPNACLGFSTSPQNPAITTTGTRRGPFFQNWESARLIRDVNGFFVYRDAWKAPAGRTPQPYAYFSAYGVQNGYKNAWSGGNDCAGLGLLPYVAANGAYANPNTYQIISAGKDCVFGTGGPWNPLGGGNPADPNGNDNQSNFAKGIIEAGQ